ncbi:hypothetical protein HYZ99_05715 [Candidatus Peregrinibacteria bacterium]|nr:hypothetical protein [Candidatus Peregrinibacteria bacterium]
MKRIACGVLAALLQISALPGAYAAPAPHATEPVTGFTRGPNPEWSAPHMEAHEDREDHRRYHQTMEQTHRDWLDARPDEKDTERYDEDYRTLRAGLNDAHRLAHERSALWHFEFGKRAETASPMSRSKFGTIQKPVHVPTEAFVRTGRPTVTKKTRRQVLREYEEQTALRPVRG